MADIYEAAKRRVPEAARVAIVAHMEFIEARLNERMRDMQIIRKER